MVLLDLLQVLRRVHHFDIPCVIIDELVDADHSMVLVRIAEANRASKRIVPAKRI